MLEKHHIWRLQLHERGHTAAAQSVDRGFTRLGMPFLFDAFLCNVFELLAAKTWMNIHQVQGLFDEA